MRFSLKIIGALVSLALAACSPVGSQRPTNTPLLLPSPTPFVVARTHVTPTPTATVSPSHTPSPAPSSTPTPTGTPVVVARRQAAPAEVNLTHATAPSAIKNALAAAGIDANVYWFKSGDEDQLMVQYASPLRYRPGYEELMQRVKGIVAPYFLKIQPALYTLWIAATDLTGTSDNVLRLDRYTVERWSRGEIGDADFYNNGFVPARIIIDCAGDECTGARPTPYPTFPPFPFPFPTP